MMQLFHEIYGNYYNTIAAILDQAIRSKVSVNEIEKIVAWYWCSSLNRAVYGCRIPGYAGKNRLLYADR